MKLWHVWARRMYVDGKSIVEIRRVFGKDEQTVRWALDLNGERAETRRRIKKYRAAKRAGGNLGFSDEERAARSARMKELRKDPAFVAKVRQGASRAMKARWALIREVEQRRSLQ